MVLSLIIEWTTMMIDDFLPALKLCSVVVLETLTRVSAGLTSVSWSPAGLQILYTLLQNVSAEETAAQSFYQTYFCDILQHIFSVVTDTSHTAGTHCGLASHPFHHRRICSCLFPAPCLQV